MKKSIAGILSAVVLLASTFVWYSCTRDAEVTTGGIYGTVTDYATGEPVGNANVKLKTTGEATLTGSDGTYEFRDLKPDNYSLQLSKAGYNDLDDDYVITVEAGKKTKRDVQMSKQVASLKITDMAGNSITELDFGMEESITTKSFNIFNNGSLNITCEITYSCAWITSVSNINNPITPGQTVTVTVTIDRSRLASGDNSTILQIISNNGSNMLTVKATGIDFPTIITSTVTNFTTTSATCGGNVTDNGGSFVSERGVCWATNHGPNIENSDKMIMGNGNGSFSGVISGLTLNTTYYVRAYAINNKGTAYGDEISFTTADGTPSVNTITPSRTGTMVITGGNVVSDEGSPVTARGVCYGTTPYPDLSVSHSHTENGYGTGTFSSTFEITSMNIFYIRAYATNDRGTSYGEQMTIGHPYAELPTFTWNGQIYRVAPSPTSPMTISNALDYCDTLTLYGFSDWRLPSVDELEQMYLLKEEIGGFNSGWYWSCTNSGTHWSMISFSTGQRGTGVNASTNTYNVRPIRIEQ